MCPPAGPSRLDETMQPKFHVTCRGRKWRRLRTSARAKNTHTHTHTISPATPVIRTCQRSPPPCLPHAPTAAHAPVSPENSAPPRLARSPTLHHARKYPAKAVLNHALTSMPSAFISSSALAPPNPQSPILRTALTSSIPKSRHPAVPEPRTRQVRRNFSLGDPAEGMAGRSALLRGEGVGCFHTRFGNPCGSQWRL